MSVAPSTFIALLLVAGAVLAIRPKRRQLALIFSGAGAALYLLLGSGWMAMLLMHGLESRHAPATEDRFGSGRAVVILAGYARAEPGVSSTAQLNRASAFRVLEAARLLARQPLPVYISGSGEVPVALERALRSVSVTGPNVEIQVDSRASNTYESGINLKPQLQDRPFYLVTSAGHMPRSMAVFESLGMTPIPIPTDFLSEREWYRADPLPSGRYLAMSDLAIHEYAGILWYRLTGRL